MVAFKTKDVVIQDYKILKPLYSGLHNTNLYSGMVDSATDPRHPSLQGGSTRSPTMHHIQLRLQAITAFQGTFKGLCDRKSKETKEIKKQ